MIAIEIANEQGNVRFDAARLRRAVEAILRDAGIVEAEISLAVVDDPTIHELNRRYLAHDEPTDVLSFLLDRQPGRLEGEVVASGDTAARVAGQLDWPAEDELLLYVIHGTLHLVGHDDSDPDMRASMREAERRYLALFDLKPREEPRADDALPV